MSQHPRAHHTCTRISQSPSQLDTYAFIPASVTLPVLRSVTTGSTSDPESCNLPADKPVVGKEAVGDGVAPTLVRAPGDFVRDSDYSTTMAIQLALKTTDSNINEMLIWDCLPWLGIVLRWLRIWLLLNLRRQLQLRAVVVLVAAEML